VRSLELLGFHGVVVQSPRPRAAARAWSRSTGLPARQRGPEFLLGRGPELFVLIRRAPPGEEERIVELHLAARDLPIRRSRVVPDALGGDGFSREAPGARLVVREFRRPPSAAWRRRRGKGR